ncbi:mRNA turnover protein 4 homolog [Anoplophora glabripennis]|uniref:mRNA turnover protein n=1 Tax=Anoplophora glabripennis TaxID=217634 RepID=V5FZF7_ANOGL|nr:mRNA turnover protein 4 homolog [Anoplophora glabripennis]
MSKSKIKEEQQLQRFNLIKEQQEEFKADMKNYNVLYVFSYKDIRTNIMKQIVEYKEWERSKIWYARNKMITVLLKNLALAHSEWPDLTKLASTIKGQIGVLFTNRPQWEIKEWFNKFSVWDYPLPGFEVDVTIKLDSGPLTLFQPEMVPYLKQMGMRVADVDGIVFLKRPFLVCRAGTILSKRQVNLLHLLGEKLAVFQLHLKAVWTKGGGLEILNDEDESDGERMDANYN